MSSPPGPDPHAVDGATAADVAVVIVVHNSTDVLAHCLVALRAAAERVDTRAIVIDSGSSDDPGPICREHGVALVRVPNRGLGAAFNQALARDEVRRARYVLQLNPDVELPTGGLDALVARADQLPDCGVLAPRQVDQRGDLIHSIGLEPTAARYLRAINPFHDGWIWVRDSERYRAECEADWIMGACLLLRREMLTATGGFDERFFYSSEEVDLCRRSREAGWSVNYLPDVTVVHPLAGRPLDPSRVRHEEWSRILYTRKWLSWHRRCLMRPALVVRYALLSVLETQGPGPGEYNRIRLSVALRPRWRGGRGTERPAGELIEILTMSDMRFLPLTLALHRSLIAHAREFRLTVLCMDDPSASFLRHSRLARVRLVELAELEAADPELAALRDRRSWREYCWTATPAFCHYSLLRAPAGAVVLWSDSDVEFLRDPTDLVAQLDDGSCLLTPHRYNRAYPISAPGWSSPSSTDASTGVRSHSGTTRKGSPPRGSGASARSPGAMTVASPGATATSSISTTFRSCSLARAYSPSPAACSARGTAAAFASGGQPKARPPTVSRCSPITTSRCGWVARRRASRAGWLPTSSGCRRRGRRSKRAPSRTTV